MYALNCQLCLVVELMEYCLLLGMIDVAAVWMSDLKEGVCPANVYYDRAACCWLSNQTKAEFDHCTSWQSWSDHLGIASPAG